MIIIDESGDITLCVKEYDDFIKVTSGQAAIIREEEEFLVSREVITTSSKPIAMLIGYHKLSNQGRETFTLEDDRVRSMQIWLNVLHSNVFTDQAYLVDLSEIWHITATTDKYQFDITLMYPWFEGWYSNAQTSESSDNRLLLYPCWRYDHAQGFLDATRKVVYTVESHVTEKNPTELKEFHLPPRVTQQLNAAKGRLRTILHAALFKPVERLLRASCSCKEKTLFDYIKALNDTRVWPFEPIWTKMKVNDILELLGRFSYQPDAKACHTCRQDYISQVRMATFQTAHYFDGLCLDCMDHSQAKTGDEDDDYWEHNERREGDWSRGCRVTHGQPSWFFSFMGRRERRDHLLKVMQGKKRGYRMSGYDSSD